MALTATVGVASTLAVWADAGAPEGYDMSGDPVPPNGIAGIPPGMRDDGTHKFITGTPTTPGTFVVTFMGEDWGQQTQLDGSSTVTVVGAPAGPDPDPEPGPAVVRVPVGELATVDLFAALGESSASPSAYDDHQNLPPGMVIDPTNRKRITGTPTTPGVYAVEVYAADPLGNGYPLGIVSITVAGSEPDPGPEPGDPPVPPAPELDPFDLYDILARSLAPRVAAFVGRPGDEDTIATAAAQVPVVTEYVRGYTRGRGFTDEAPAGPLRAVIVSGVARLATNPEQVAHFQTGDYSERPAQLAGWTLTELGVLRRYRRTAA